MSTTRTGHDFDTQALATTGARTVLRAKTVATVRAKLSHSPPS
jgi:hypothetical protein